MGKSLSVFINSLQCYINSIKVLVLILHINYNYTHITQNK